MDIPHAIKSLYPEAQFHGPPDNYEETVFIVKPTGISKAKVVAKLAELIAAEPIRLLRIERDQLLAETDWRDLPSYAGTRQAEWRVYRQALRDITAGLDTVDKVNAVIWPTKPE